MVPNDLINVIKLLNSVYLQNELIFAKFNKFNEFNTWNELDVNKFTKTLHEFIVLNVFTEFNEINQLINKSIH